MPILWGNLRQNVISMRGRKTVVFVFKVHTCLVSFLCPHMAPLGTWQFCVFGRLSCPSFLHISKGNLGIPPSAFSYVSSLRFIPPSSNPLYVQFTCRCASFSQSILGTSCFNGHKLTLVTQQRALWLPLLVEVETECKVQKDSNKRHFFHSKEKENSEEICKAHS